MKRFWIAIGGLGVLALLMAAIGIWLGGPASQTSPPFRDEIVIGPGPIDGTLYIEPPTGFGQQLSYCMDPTPVKQLDKLVRFTKQLKFDSVTICNSSAILGAAEMTPQNSFEAFTVNRTDSKEAASLLDEFAFDLSQPNQPLPGGPIMCTTEYQTLPSFTVVIGGLSMRPSAPFDECNKPLQIIKQELDQLRAIARRTAIS